MHPWSFISAAGQASISPLAEYSNFGVNDCFSAVLASFYAYSKDPAGAKYQADDKTEK